jgi:hypothetical protein
MIQVSQSVKSITTRVTGFVQGGRLMQTLPNALNQTFETTSIAVPLGELMQTMRLAQNRHLSWVQDFLDDEVAISPDLYELLLSFQHRFATPKIAC